MKNVKSRRGFTLVEVLIVVVIMAILAATIIPQFSDSSSDAKISSAKFNLHTLRSQIELYKSQHDGKFPNADLSDLTKSTDVNGNSSGSGPFPYGPYIRELPAHSWTGSKTVAAPGAVPPTAEVDGAGWLYDLASGKLFINKTGQFGQ